MPLSSKVAHSGKSLAQVLNGVGIRWGLDVSLVRNLQVISACGTSGPIHPYEILCAIGRGKSHPAPTLTWNCIVIFRRHKGIRIGGQRHHGTD